VNTLPTPSSRPAPATGKLGVLLPGLGAVATTFIAGVELARRGLGRPIGSLTQLGTIRLGKRTDRRTPKLSEFVPISPLEDLVFGAWDPIPDNAYDSALQAGVLDRHEHIEPIADFLKSIEPMPAAFDRHYVKRLDGINIKPGTSKRAWADALREDIRRFKAEHGCERLVMVWCGSTEIYIQPGPAHQSIEAFERAIDADDEAIAPSMLYAYAAIMEGVPYANGAPNLSVDFPALIELANERGVPVAGKDFKTGQTLMKTIIAPGLKARMLGLDGWFSTNILGNRDGAVLDDPDSFKTKEESKLSVLEYILQPNLYPDLYQNYYHKVRITGTWTLWRQFGRSTQLPITYWWSRTRDKYFDIDDVYETTPGHVFLSQVLPQHPSVTFDVVNKLMTKKEISNMIPADGKKPDRARPLPENPPEGIEVYPATTNKTLSGPIEYERTPPTNGNHDPLWQNCGFYERPIKDRHAVHSMDHGVVWITYRPNLPSGQVDKLRPYGEEDYVIFSPYPGQDAPVTATSWRVQLELDGADDPRLREFVDGFRVSEIAPLSGNRCEGGVGNPRA
jgi:myo-inositol-1-phosphate synthase